MKLVLVIAQFVTGGLLITKAITGATWAQILSGQASAIYAANQSSLSSSSTAATSGGASSATAAAKIGKVGAGETGFARAFLNTIGAPLNKTNISALEDWWAAEEGPNVLVPGHGGLNNPFEVTTSGNANVPSLGSVNSAGVKSYATTQAGVQAAIGYFEEYGPGVLQAFKNGQSITNIEAAVRDLGPNAFGSDTNSAWTVN